MAEAIRTICVSGSGVSRGRAFLPATAALFRVSVATAVRWSQRHRVTGSAAVGPQRYRHPRSLERERGWLLERLAAKPNVTLRGLVAELVGRRVLTSYGSVWRIVRDAGITLKKEPDRTRAGPDGGCPTTCAMAQVPRLDRPSSFRLRRRDLGQDEHDPLARLVPARGAAGRQGAARPLAHADLPRRIVLRPDRRTARARRPINGQSFTAYIEQFLLPTLSPDDIVVMDNLGSH
jgi:transposase